MALDVNGSIAFCPVRNERCSGRCAWFNHRVGSCSVYMIADALVPIADRAVVNE